MGLAISVDRVAEVLLVDGWHKVDFDERGVSTFAMDAYDYIWSLPSSESTNEVNVCGYGDGQTISTTGAVWLSKGITMYAPLNAIQSVKLAKL